MGYNAINAYDATSFYPEFRGLQQYTDAPNSDPRYAVDACNMDTTGGGLRPLGAPQLLPGGQLVAPIETLALLHRRWYTDPADRDLLVAATQGKLYARTLTEDAWTELDPPAGVGPWQGTEWSWCCYEINEPGAAAPIDVLLMSNALDGMIMIRGDTLAVSLVPAPKKFGVIERFAERIWGGDIIDDPDMLVYSAPYDPTDWEARIEIPEDGAGDILQPSWDGDRFTALKSFGSQLIAFKRTRVWRILGTDPGEYTFKEQYGGGAPYASTVAVDGERIYMLTDRGVAVYDGASVNPFGQEYAQQIFQRMNKAAMDKACACAWQGRYYCAIPLDDSTECNAVIVYNALENTWLLHTAVAVSSFLPTDDRLYFTSPTSPSSVYLWNTDSWASGCSVGPSRWVTPWNDLSYKSIVKGGYEVYLLPEVQDEPVNLRISVQTEKKIKTKTYTVQPLTEEQKLLGKSHKQKRLHFGGSGRRFRLIIECDSTAPWRLVGGLMVVSETDPD